VDLETRLKYRFRDPGLLERALTHRSSAHEAATGPGDYERLEFLGDALLGLLVAEWLLDLHPEANEGQLTRLMAAVVSTRPLARTARDLGLGDALRWGRGEDESGGRDKPSLLSDAFESVLAAVYLDGGIRPARAFVRRHLKAQVVAAGGARDLGEDFKTRLQELAQARWRLTPRYRLAGSTGPDHARTFSAEVLIDGRVAGRGEGSSRKDAEQDAARRALDGL
jgi:ribonuclease-3